MNRNVWYFVHLREKHTTTKGPPAGRANTPEAGTYSTPLRVIYIHFKYSNISSEVCFHLSQVKMDVRKSNGLIDATFQPLSLSTVQLN